MKQIVTFLSFKNEAEQAAKYYCSIFKKKSRILNISCYGKSGPGPKGSVMMVEFELNGQKYLALNGGPHGFNQAVSLMVLCDTQKEIDYFWEKLSRGGEKIVCGWLKDKYGLSWQVCPAIIPKLLKGPNSDRVLQAVIRMKKLDLAALKKAAK